MADIVLYLAVFLVIVVVLMAIPRARVANEETLAALHRQQEARRQQLQAHDTHSELAPEQPHRRHIPHAA